MEAGGYLCAIRTSLVAECATRCLTDTPRLTGGAPACTLFVTTASAPCPASLGWLAPDPSDPRLPPPPASGEHLCRVRPLEGDDLVACRTQLACPGCSAGYSFTEVPELGGSCNAPHPPLPRFIGGAGRVRPGLPPGLRSLRSLTIVGIAVFTHSAARSRRGRATRGALGCSWRRPASTWPLPRCRSASAARPLRSSLATRVSTRSSRCC